MQGHVMLQRLWFIILVVALSAVSAQAQARPDFRGRWVPVDPAKANGTPVLEHLEPAEEEITQTDASVGVTRRWRGAAQRDEHAPDNVSRQEGRMAARVWWDGDRLFSEHTQTVAIPGRTVTTTTREARWLEGDTMVVTITWIRDGVSHTRRSVYRRAQ